MKSAKNQPDNWNNWICPNLSANWQLGKLPDSDEIIFQAKDRTRKLRLSADVGCALQYFTGQFTVAQVQEFCQQQLGDGVSPDLVLQLIEKLVALQIIELPGQGEAGKIKDENTSSPPAQNPPSPSLKSCVHWIEHPDGYWILRNPKDVTFLQLDNRSQIAIEDLGKLPLAEIAQKHQLTSDELRHLLQLLVATGMLEGTKPPKPPKRKFTPLSLLSFQFSLFNPDPWLTGHIDSLRWIWTHIFGIILCLFLGYSAAIGLSEQQNIFRLGKQLIATEGASLILPFVLLSLLVVTIHELGHAFTLKHYGGIVPEVGIRFMLLMPSAYTNTTDAYCLVKRRQRTLVVAAGVLVQIIIWAIAFWLWTLSSIDTWLSTTSFLLMAAALFTVALNLNPLSKFDGYYLAVALSGINNLRSRSFKLYGNLLRGKSTNESIGDALILIAYAPFSLAYTILVFGHLFGWLGEFSLTNIPFFALTLLLLWAIYFFWPNSNSANSPKKAASTPMTSPNSEPRPQLKVVQPPTDKRSPETTPEATPTAPTATANKSPNRWTIVAVVAISLGLISFIPIPFDVGGSVQLETKEGAREQIRTPIPGVIQDILVKSRDEVKKDQIIAHLSSIELDKEIADAQNLLDQNRHSLQTVKRQQIASIADTEKARAAGEAMREKANRYNDRAAKLLQGQLPPDIQVLEAQKAKIQSQLKDAEIIAKRRQDLYAQGVVSQEERGKAQNAFDNLQNELAAKGKEIDTAKQRLIDTATDSRSDASTQATTIRGSEMLREDRGQIVALQQGIANLETRIKDLKTRKESLTLKATISGTVITSDLDKKKNTSLKPGEEFLLEIADLRELTATVEIREEDRKYVEVGQSVKFRPLQDKLRTYEARVEEIVPQVLIDSSQQKRVVLVKIVVNNKDAQLMPKGSGYAKIGSDSIFLYKRIGRELKRLVPLEKFLN